MTEVLQMDFSCFFVCTLIELKFVPSGQTGAEQAQTITLNNVAAQYAWRHMASTGYVVLHGDAYIDIIIIIIKSTLCWDSLKQLCDVWETVVVTNHDKFIHLAWINVSSENDNQSSSLSIKNHICSILRIFMSIALWGGYCQSLPKIWPTSPVPMVLDYDICIYV